jgi:carbon-monoxide dehydrogenase large subunit
MATTTPTKVQPLTGQRVRRREDPRLITGTATYVDDVKKPGMLYAAILRSPHAAAKIKSLRTEAAAKAPGVYAIFTGADVEGVGPVPCAAALPGLRVPKHTILATNRVYYVGHPVAVVVATDRYKAADALDLIEIDYEPGKAVSDPEKALEAGAPAVHPEWPDNIAFTQHTEYGDARKAFAEAEVVVKQRITSQRLIPAAMETRGVVAEWSPGDKLLTIYSSTQIPHLMRTQVALMLGIPENHVRVIAPEVGGGFGSKLNVYAEEALVGFVSMRVNKPIKWIEGRRENFQVTIHGRGHVDYVELAAKKDGTITGMRIKIIQDLGAYHQLLGPLIPTLSVLMLPGIYNFHNAEADIVGVFTNAAPTDAYRGAGRPEATHCIERIVDILAAKLGLDPAEIRLKNFPSKDAFPFQTATGLMYDSGDYAKPLERALQIVDYQNLRKKQAEARKNGRYIGVGISTYGEICAFGPSPATPAGGWESATVKVEPTGKVTIMSGASPHGQGQETSFAQLAADAFGVSLDDVVVLHGDTAIVQYGIGTFGSRATAVGGTAVYLALQDLRAKCAKFAAHMLGVSADEVALEAGVFSSPKTTKTVTFQDVALEAHICRNLPPGLEPGLVATRFFEPSNFAFPFGAHIAQVEVDQESGEVRIERYVAVDDCGKVINPLLVDGQVHGGVAQALGQALYEEAVYDEYGQLITGELMSYAVPKAHHVPEIETDRTETPSPVNPLGVKGVGEAGTIGCSPALVNAVVDALSPLGITHIDMPMTPQKVWRLIQERSQA